MKKITNKQTAPSLAVVLNVAQLAIRANAVAVADVDLSDALAGRVLEFGVMFANKTVDDFKACRADWVAAYIEATGCEPASAGTRFAEMVRASGVVKPQSEKAAKLQAARAAAKSVVDKAMGDAGDDVKAGVADKATATVKMELSSIEAHIVSLMRAGKFTLAAQAIADMATAKA